MSGFLDDITALIVYLWNLNTLGRIGATLLVVTILVVATGLVWLVIGLVFGAVNLIIWLINRRHCTHCSNWTMDRSEGKYLQCPRGQFCCSSCTFKHKMDDEPKINCPVCGEEMIKLGINNEIIADACPKKHGTWLGTDELQRVQDIAYSYGHSNGHGRGIATGIIIS